MIKNTSYKTRTATIKVFLMLVSTLFLVGFVSAAWSVNTTINASLPDLGTFSVPTVFYKDASWYMISGAADGRFYGFVWDGDNWVTNLTINQSLYDARLNDRRTAPTIFKINSDWYALAGNNGIPIFGWALNTNGTWMINLTINASLPAIGDTRPFVFQMDSDWYLLLGNYDGNFLGFKWNGAGWSPNLIINASLPDIGIDATPTVFQMDLDTYLMSGDQDTGGFFGYKWSGTAWEVNTTINSSLPSIGTNSNPSVFYKNDSWYMLAGANDGKFYGFNMSNGTIQETTTFLVNLTSPTNNSIISTLNQSFLVNLSMSGTNFSYQWKNNTYYIWFNNGTLFNSTLVTGLSTNSTTTSRNMTNFVVGNYIWNSYACYDNVTTGNCSWATNNYTFQYRPFSLDSQTYTTSIYETSRQTYTANITTISSILNIIARLNYNGTLKTATSTCSAGSCYINISFDIPLVTLETQNKSSYWNITLFDGTSSYSFNTIESNFTQNVSMIHLAECNATYPTQTLNFTSWNEKNLSRISLFSFAGTFETWLGSGTVKKNQSFQNTSTSQFRLCLAPNQTIYTDAVIRYAFNNENESYITRDYYFQNASLTNTSQDIYLYLLEAEDSTTFIDKVQDQKLSVVKDALIYIQRYYPETGLYRTVQIAKTDSNGETVGFYETELADYKHIIIKNGVTLLETSPQKVVGKEVPFTLTFTVGEALDYPWSVFEDNPAITTSLTYNDTTKLVSFTYVDSTGSTTLGRLLVYELSKSNNTIRTICNSSSTESSATITCNMTAEGEGNFLAYGYIQTDVSEVFDFTIKTARDILDRTGLLMGFLIILTAGFAFIWNPTAGVVGVEGAIIFVNVIGLVSFSPIFIFASIAIAIIALILLKS